MRNSKKSKGRNQLSVAAPVVSPVAAPLTLVPTTGGIVKEHLVEKRWSQALDLLEADLEATIGSPRLFALHSSALRSFLRDARSRGDWSTGLARIRLASSNGLISMVSSAAATEFISSAALACSLKRDFSGALDILGEANMLQSVSDDAWKSIHRPVLKIASALGNEAGAADLTRLFLLIEKQQDQILSAEIEPSVFKSLYSALKDLIRAKKLGEAETLLCAAGKLKWQEASVRHFAVISGTLVRGAISNSSWLIAARALETLARVRPQDVAEDTQLRRLLRPASTRETFVNSLVEANCAMALLALAKCGILETNPTGQFETVEASLRESLSNSASEVSALREEVKRLRSGQLGKKAANTKPAEAGLSEAQSYVLEEVRRTGICKIAFSDYFGPAGTALWDEASKWMEEFSTCDALKEYMNAFSTAKDTIVGDEKFRKDRPNKLFEFNRADYGKPLALDEPSMKIGLRTEVLDLASAYLGCLPKMRSAVSWVHVPMYPSLYKRQASQQWHRDQEDEKVFKLFTLFNDIDIDTGPFEYIPESTPSGRYAGVWGFGYKSGGTGYPPPGHVEKFVPPEDRFIGVCKRGTLLFVDTCGIHRGGYVTLKPRVATQTTYLRPNAPGRILQNTLYKPTPEEARNYTPAQLFAMSGPQGPEAV